MVLSANQDFSGPHVHEAGPSDRAEGINDPSAMNRLSPFPLREFFVVTGAKDRLQLGPAVSCYCSHCCVAGGLLAFFDRREF